jgi:hypothetical protein
MMRPNDGSNEETGGNLTQAEGKLTQWVPRGTSGADPPATFHVEHII